MEPPFKQPWISSEHRIMMLSIYAVLCILLAAEALAVNVILKRTLGYEKLLDQRLRGLWSGPLPGADVPRFRVTYLDSPKTLTNADLEKGSAAVLVFLSSAMPPRIVFWVLEVVRSRVPGVLYAVCNDSRPECLALRDACVLSGSVESTVFLYDEGNSLAVQFGIESRPSVVAIDDTGCIAKTGVAKIGNPVDAPARNV